ncbi:hypothetical protein [Myxococcus sp. Y35]|uniref:hypothetical protein n=1 Tax=Pseudomyxococcus flavus TaxID=3115648 RepID=UPI003CEBE4B5
MALSAPVTREELKQHLEALGREATTRGPGLKAVTDLFRLYWLAVQHNLVVDGPEHTLDLKVNASWVEEGLKMPRLPPHENTLPVRPREERCRCPPNAAGIYTLVALSGLTRRACTVCNEDWRVLEG